MRGALGFYRTYHTQTPSQFLCVCDAGQANTLLRLPYGKRDNGPFSLFATLFFFFLQISRVKPDGHFSMWLILFPRVQYLQRFIMSPLSS